VTNVIGGADERGVIPLLNSRLHNSGKRRDGRSFCGHVNRERRR
jgi:hypothetical protein